ncbi:O-antigen ligase family protein [Pseudomonadales bacterium]|nr:O-antigen ligase family protein [Pseudomonadales bacterium]
MTSLTLPRRTILTKTNVRNAIILSPLLIFVGLFNRYIFVETYLNYFASCVCLFLIFKNHYRLKRIMFINRVVISIFVFLSYTLIRIDYDFFLAEMNNDSSGFFDDISNLSTYLILFIFGTILSFNKSNGSDLIWLAVSIYMIMYILRTLYSLDEVQAGAHLGAGTVIISLLPFVLLGLKNYEYKERYATIILCIGILFMVLVGARTAALALIVLVFVLNMWPYLIKNKFRFNLVLLTTMAAILFLYLVYIVYMTHDGEPLIAESSIGAFQKSTDTRFVIWVHLLATIQDNIWWGVGSLKSTAEASPLAYLDFSMNRKNLAAHSLYFELIYRLGVVGLSLFLAIIFALWACFWKGRNFWEIKVAASVLIAILFLASSSVVIVFSAMELRWGFVWLFFGIAFGSSLPKISIDSKRTRNNFKI